MIQQQLRLQQQKPPHQGQQVNDKPHIFLMEYLNFKLSNSKNYEILILSVIHAPDNSLTTCLSHIFD